MGRKMVMVAGLLATSVMDVTITQAIVTMASTGRFPNGLISSATQVDKPDAYGLNNRIGKNKNMEKSKKNNSSVQDTLKLSRMAVIYISLRNLSAKFAMTFGLLD